MAEILKINQKVFVFNLNHSLNYWKEIFISINYLVTISYYLCSYIAKLRKTHLLHYTKKDILKDTVLEFY